MPETQHILLADDTPAKDIDAAIEQVGGQTGVRFGNAESDKVGGVTIRSFPDVSDTGHTLVVVDDPKGGRHIAVEGPKRRSIARALAKALPVEKPDALVARASESRAPRDVLRVALSQSGAPSDEAVGVIVTALRSTEADVVDAGIVAAVIADHERFEGDLRRLAAEAPDSSLRLLAEQALEGEAPR